MLNLILKKLVSGGQTGADQGALKAAQALGLAIGGWCPKGRKAENGVIPDVFPLKETDSEDYNVRTRLNVQDSDGTLIILNEAPMGGTLLTKEIAHERSKPCLIYHLSKDTGTDSIVEWIKKNNIQVLNVAGPRESQSPGIQEAAYKLTHTLLLNPKLKLDSLENDSELEEEKSMSIRSKL